ncbi:MAG TPA: hypothetical protein VHB73_01855, partial [Alphaproteobacteria bacterium]|nr:hypothetical protein [Alphaproteobacteria bacterium]
LQLGTLSLSLRSLAQDNGKPLAQTVGYENGRYTLDSDISNLIPAPKDKIEVNSEVVRVLRGKEKNDATFVDKSSGPGAPDPGDVDETRHAQP